MTSHCRPLYRRTLATPIGELQLVVRDDGAVVAVNLPAADVTARVAEALAGDVRPDRGQGDLLARQLDEFFTGERRSFDLPLAPVGTTFQLAAWQALVVIPFGETRSYQDQAQRIGRPKAVRAVGAANGQNPIAIVVPCHRVIGKRGSLTGFGGGLACKQWLLDHEAAVLAGCAPRSALA
ncbi:MAG: methylated-DNA--[protein]-cysteine S-methyltransferase [Planctomycetota bacterium]